MPYRIEEKLKRFERKIFRRICSRNKVGEEYGNLMNTEIDQILNDVNIVRYIKEKGTKDKKVWSCLVTGGEDIFKKSRS